MGMMIDHRWSHSTSRTVEKFQDKDNRDLAIYSRAGRVQFLDMFLGMGVSLTDLSLYHLINPYKHRHKLHIYFDLLDRNSSMVARVSMPVFRKVESQSRG